MTSSFKITEYLDIPNFPERFGKAIFFGHTIIIDTWTGLINATDFCKQFDRKEFYHFLEDDFERSDIIHFYDTITPLNDNWKDIYTYQNNLYIIKGQREGVQDIGGTYIHYKSFIKVGIWCDYKLRMSFYSLLIELSNLYNVQRMSNEEIKIQDMTNFLSTVIDDRKRGKMSEKEMFNFLVEMFPDENFEFVANNRNSGDIKNGNIVIEIKNSKTGTSKKNIVKLKKDMCYQNSPLGIMFLFHGKSNIDFKSRIIFINVHEINIFKDVLSTLFREYKDKSAPSDNNGVVEYTLNSALNTINPLYFSKNKKNGIKVNKTSQQSEDHEKVKWEIAAYKSLLPLYGKEKIQERINALPDSNKNKVKYQDLFNKGNFKKLPKCVLYG